MATTPNYGFFSVPSTDFGMNLIDWVEHVDGDVSTSNIMLIDAILYALESNKANKVVEDSNVPSGLNPGDEWDKLL